MPNIIINDFKNYCIHLGLSDNSVKDLVNYINSLFDFLKEFNISSLQQVSYKQLVNFSISGNAAPTTVKACPGIKKVLLVLAASRSYKS